MPDLSVSTKVEIDFDNLYSQVTKELPNPLNGSSAAREIGGASAGAAVKWLIRAIAAREHTKITADKLKILNEANRPVNSLRKTINNMGMARNWVAMAAVRVIRFQKMAMTKTAITGASIRAQQSWA